MKSTGKEQAEKELQWAITVLERLVHRRNFYKPRSKLVYKPPVKSGKNCPSCGRLMSFYSSRRCGLCYFTEVHDKYNRKVQEQELRVRIAERALSTFTNGVAL